MNLFVNTRILITLKYWAISFLYLFVIFLSRNKKMFPVSVLVPSNKLVEVSYLHQPLLDLLYYLHFIQWFLLTCLKRNFKTQLWLIINVILIYSLPITKSMRKLKTLKLWLPVIITISSDNLLTEYAKVCL